MLQILKLNSENQKASKKQSSEKLTPGLDFTYILCSAFTFADPKSAKNIDCLTAFFALLGSVQVKAAHKMLMKLTPD